MQKTNGNQGTVKHNLLTKYVSNNSPLYVECRGIVSQLNEYGDNLTLLNKINAEQINFERKVEQNIERGLRFNEDDYYCFIQKGDKLSLKTQPKGGVKLILMLGERYDVSISLNIGVIRENDEVLKMSFVNGFDEFELKKDITSAIWGNSKKDNSRIVAPYAYVTTMRNNIVVGKKLFIVPNDEYSIILNKSGGWAKQYQTTHAKKVVLKRVLDEVSSILGSKMSSDDSKLMSEVRKDMFTFDISNESQPQPQQPQSQPQPQQPQQPKSQEQEVKTSESEVSKLVTGAKTKFNLDGKMYVDVLSETLGRLGYKTTDLKYKSVETIKKILDDAITLSNKG